MTHPHHSLFQHALVVVKPWLSPRGDQITITSPLVMLYIRVGKALAEPSR